MAGHLSITPSGHHESPTPSSTDHARKGILRSLIYYGLFGFPLRIEELLQYSEVPGPTERHWYPRLIPWRSKA